ncbi:MAG: patatin-like phospholipase family protein [bacterium JZ-2024 1]
MHSGFPDKFTLVLGGGGAKGYAHLGVLQALEEYGRKPALVVGTSMGALIGFLYCTGNPLSTIIAEVEKINRIAFFRLAGFSPWSGMWLFSLKGLERRLRGATGDPLLENLPIKLCTVAVEAHTGKKHIFRRGNAVDAVLASIAVPGYFRPLKKDGIFWVDGGLVEPLPVESARELGSAFIVAVDVWSRRTAPTYPPSRPFTLFSSFTYSVDLFLTTLNQKAHRLADLVIAPDCSGIHWFHFHRAKEAIALGYQEAKKILREYLGYRSESPVADVPSPDPSSEKTQE